MLLKCKSVQICFYYLGVNIAVLFAPYPDTMLQKVTKYEQKISQIQLEVFIHCYLKPIFPLYFFFGNKDISNIVKRSALCSMIITLCKNSIMFLPYNILSVCILFSRARSVILVTVRFLLLGGQHDRYQ